MFAVKRSIILFGRQAVYEISNCSFRRETNFVRFFCTPLGSSMKRTRATSKLKSDNHENSEGKKSDTICEKSATNLEAPKQVKLTPRNFSTESLSTKVKEANAENSVSLSINTFFTPSTQDSTVAPSKSQDKIDLKTLREKKDQSKEDIAPHVITVNNRLRAVVNLEEMIAELKQLEDPPISQKEKELTSNRLPYSFFDTPCEQLARNLLGKVLVRRLENGTILKGMIVETEGYLGAIDKASHSYQNKVTARNLPMYMPPGDGCAVLIRAVDPLEGIEHMTVQRNSKARTGVPKKTAKPLKTHELCNGPSKLCIAFELAKIHSKYSMCSWKGLWVEDYGVQEKIQIVRSTRIGIDSCGTEWASKPLRYYIYGNKSVSKRDKKVEKLMELV